MKSLRLLINSLLVKILQKQLHFNNRTHGSRVSHINLAVNSKLFQYVKFHSSSISARVTLHLKHGRS